MENDAEFEFSDTICRQVANRIPNITTFAMQNDIVIFVCGKKSSNGKVLFEHCRSVNPHSYQIFDPDEVAGIGIDLTKKIGICGATSTPKWQMEAVAKKLEELAENR